MNVDRAPFSVGHAKSAAEAPASAGARDGAERPVFSLEAETPRAPPPATDMKHAGDAIGSDGRRATAAEREQPSARRDARPPAIQEHRFSQDRAGVQRPVANVGRGTERSDAGEQPRDSADAAESPLEPGEAAGPRVGLQRRPRDTSAGASVSDIVPPSDPDPTLPIAAPPMLADDRRAFKTDGAPQPTWSAPQDATLADRMFQLITMRPGLALAPAPANQSPSPQLAASSSAFAARAVAPVLAATPVLAGFAPAAPVAPPMAAGPLAPGDASAPVLLTATTTADSPVAVQAAAVQPALSADQNIAFPALTKAFDSTVAAKAVSGEAFPGPGTLTDADTSRPCSTPSSSASAQPGGASFAHMLSQAPEAALYTARAVPAAPVDPSIALAVDADFDDGIGSRLLWMADQRIDHAQIRVSPEGLGPIEIRLHMEGHRVHAQFDARHADVRQALEAGMDRLRDLLGRQGMELGQAHVGSGQGHPGQHRAGDRSSASDGNEIDADAPAATTTVRSLLPRGLVDEYA